MMEGHQGGETISDIHNYLATFNKEIQSSPPKNVAQVYIDENGQYYYQNVEGEEIVVMDASQKNLTADFLDIKNIKRSSSPTQLDSSDDLQSPDNKVDISSTHHIGVSNAQHLQVLPTVDQREQSNQVILNSGQNNQIVTIVPSTTNPGEVSYVLIVEQSGDGDLKDDHVYDFNEADDGLSYLNKDPVDVDDKKLVRFIPKKSQTITPVHMCNYCNYTNPKRYLLSRHMKSHSEERPYKCSVCERGFKTLASLQNHVNTHTGIKPHRCKSCESTFTTSGNKPIYTCELCPTTCGRKTDLRIHIQKLHTSDKPLTCKKCGKAFPDRYTFKQHNKSHEGEKCFKCDLCPYASATLRHLESHMLVHTEQKPFKCKACDQAFRQKQLLKRHENLYHDPFYIPPVPKEKTQKCSECCKVFRHKGNLIRHLAVHKEEHKSEPSSIDCNMSLMSDVEVYPGEVDEEEMMTVEGHDGNQYVVLEVIQLQNGEGHVMMSDGIPVPVSENPLDTSAVLSASPLLVTDPLSVDSSIGSHTLLNITDPSKRALKIELPDTKKESQKEMESCFGFDDDDDASQINLSFGE
ncbi:Transcriptional repressor CTCFL [Armadillidium nasatum]|uniref:Transcriptional repressor CTCFL n=1 Tax=Armadillidium nasatum TaxID=96803 RepID=A0A5N5TBK0_9CRUS|nr:Transcriptional repressor CTCFL [Armadillidium nasatum]